MRFFINFVLLISAVLLGLFWLKPEWKQIDSLRKESASYRETLDNLQKIQELRDKFLEDYNSVDEVGKQRLAKMLPSSVDEGEIMVMLEDLFKSNGLFLKTIAFERKSKQAGAVLGQQKRPYHPSVLTMEFTGSYEAFKNFLKDLEKSLLIFDVDEITFGVGPKAKDLTEIIYVFKISAKTYWQD